jgi:hypothetical protein
MAGIDTVYHLVSIISLVPKVSKLVELINVQGTKNVVREEKRKRKREFTQS